MAATRPNDASGHEPTNARQQISSFDHFVGAREERGRNVEAERCRSLEVDRHLVVDRQLDRQIGWLGALEDAVNVSRRLADPLQRN
jgi:hypothetical protein